MGERRPTFPQFRSTPTTLPARMSAESPPSAVPSEPRSSTHARRRRVPLALRALRLWFALAGRVMPGLAERQAARLFLTPRRRTPRAPSFAGATARELTLTIEGRTLVGWSWGAGPPVL